MTDKKAGEITKEAAEEFLRVYLRLVKRADELDQDEARLHQEILLAIDRKKMGRIVDRIVKMK